MKDIKDVIVAKEKELEQVKKDLHCLNEVLRMLQGASAADILPKPEETKPVPEKKLNQWP
jgi:hypothetical protein